MLANVWSVRCDLVWSVVCSAAILATTCDQSARADDARTPSPEEMKAVAMLAEKGAVLFIDGEYQVTQILGGRDLTNADLQRLKVFKGLKSLSLTNSQLDDGAVNALKSLTQLKSLTLSTGAISDKTLEDLKKALPNCRTVMPSRRSFGSGSPRSSSTTKSDDRPSGWNTIEFPPVTPAPSVYFEIRSSAVQDRLKLTAEQKQEVDRVTGRDYQRQQSEVAIRKLLTTEQTSLLQQVMLQREGPTALALPEVAKDLKLTESQQATIQSVMNDRRDQLMKVGDQLRERTLDFSKSVQETTRIRSAANDRLLAVLTKSQLEAWNAKIGPPLPSSSFGGSSGEPSTEESIRVKFRNLDRNNDGQLTSAEWQRSLTTRSKFEQAKVSIEFPIKVEEFVKKYLEMDRKAIENRD